MKYILICILLLSLTSCFGKKTEIDRTWDSIVQIKNQTIESNNILPENNDKKENIASAEIIWNDNDFFSLNEIPLDAINSEEIQISWKVFSSDIAKIQVTFSNRESLYPVDEFLLKQFKKWDSVFRYVAWSRFKVLDYGLNEYVFKAFLTSWESKEIILKIYLPKQTKKVNSSSFSGSMEIWNIRYEKKMFWSEKNKQYMSFPSSSFFWEPIFASESEFSYSNIEGFIAKKLDMIQINCEDSDSITDYLVENYGNVYWNTCRPIIKDKGFSFFVLRLEGTEYMYEKHYIDMVHSIYAITLIEVGEGVTKENIWEKNSELKEKEFENVKITDTLMYEIVR